MKAGILFTGTGPILILTTYESFTDILWGLNSDLVKAFMECATKESYEKGDFLFHE